jgi:CubicO group peptidase (beta-lactamase class C family)
LNRPSSRACAAVCVLTVLLTGMASAAGPSPLPPSPIPDTPAGRRFAELMTITADGDEAAITKYVRENFTESMYRARSGDPGITPFLVDLARRFRGFDVVSSIPSPAETVTMLVRPIANPNRWIRYVVTVEATPPHLVAGLFLIPAATADVPNEGAPLRPDEAVMEFTKDVDRAIASGEFSGVVLLARGGDVVLRRAAGQADREHQVPVSADTVFGLGSMNKMFTAVAIAKLVEDGRVAWSDPVEKHLKGWLPDGGKSITIEQLLTHTSGLGDYLESITSDPKLRDARTLSAYKDLVRSSTVIGKPEDGLRYSNTGYVVLGALIEAVTGGDYFEFVRAQVFLPAGMNRTNSWCRDEVVENRAIGYIPPVEAEALGLGRGWRSNALLQGARGTSAGGGLSTADDLFRFSRALLDGKVVKPKTLDALLTPRVKFLGPSDYAYGFVVQKGRDGARAFGHEGGFPGVNGELHVYGDGAFTLVVLSNVSGGAGELGSAWDAIAARVRTQEEHE